MFIRSKAPLRLGLAGGGTDVSPYSDLFGGAVLNATINLYAYTTIEPTNDNKIVFSQPQTQQYEEYPSSKILPTDGYFTLHKGIYNRVVQDFNLHPLSFRMTTHVDVPQGSGLGTSSTLVVSILGAFVEWFKLPLGEYDIAHLAFLVERSDLKMSGGKQDQYAATFGGFNYMEFYKEDKVIVNPLRIDQPFQAELSHNLLLYYTQTSRRSAIIIDNQSDNVKNKNVQAIEAMHQLKEQAILMKEIILKGEIDTIGKILDFGWTHKKQMATGISNDFLDTIYQAAINGGATGGKVSGAGGGGFMSFYCPGTNRYQVEKILNSLGGEIRNYQFTNEGLQTWRRD